MPEQRIIRANGGPLARRTVNETWDATQRLIQQSRQLIEVSRHRVLESAAKVASSRRLLNTPAA